MAEFKFNSQNIIHVFGESDKNNTLTAYHYTSPNAFHSIINDGFVRFSDIKYMNDKSESVYFVKVLLDFLDEHPGEYIFIRDVLDALIGENSYSDIQKLKVTNIVFNTFPDFEYLPSRNFLFCLSTEKDSLNMWNYYVQNGHYEGFNIGFDLFELIKTFDNASEQAMDCFLVYYGKVIYQREKQIEVVKRIVEKIDEIQNYPVVNPIQFAALHLRSDIESKGLFIKHPEFTSEREYRIVVHIADKRIPHSVNEAQKYFGENNKQIVEDFCVKNGMIVPFLKIKIPENSVSKVTISPISEFDLASRSTEEFLHIKGFKRAEVVPSKIPIRF